MYLDEPRARIGHQNGALSRAKLLALKALVIVGGVVMLASAFVVSLVFLAIGFAVVLTVGGYLWWKTRELRRQIRERVHEQSMHSQARSRPAGVVIEGEVISQERTRR
jgi:hypothetical protein